MRNFITSLRVFITFAVLLGILYPIGITLIAHLLMFDKANGSFIVSNGNIVGSALIGQEFSAPKYFHSRLSENNYDAINSGGSNASQSSKAFIDLVSANIKKIRTENNLTENTELPSDMVLKSGSGLDPHISLENALLQVSRVAKARKLPEAKVKQLISQNTDLDFIGIWGEDAVNVLKLNMALDKY